MKYFDYAIWDKLYSKRASATFPEFLDTQKGIAIDTSPEMYVYGMQQLSTHADVSEEVIFSLEMEILGVLAEMELQGVRCDLAQLQDIGKRIKIDIEAIQNQIYELVGSSVNLNSPKQIQVLLFEKLGIKPLKKNKTGYSVDNEVLEEIAKTHDIARMILEYRTLSKLDSTYISGLVRAIHPDTQKIYTTYDSLGALTGRMSSEAPNLQNIPTGDGYAREIKSCFIPESASNILLVADYSQIELRILAFLSQDKNLLQAFLSNEDIHLRTARFLFPEKEHITSHERRIAKSVNFGVIYGITGFGLSKTLDCPPWEATKYIESFYALYPGVRMYYDQLLEEARKAGYVSTYFGRKRHISGLNDANKTIRSIAEREAMNMPVQGTAADILKYAMLDLAKQIQAHSLMGKMILQVHDELVFDIPLEEKEVFESIVRESMEGVLIRMIPQTHEISIPEIRVDISYGKNWADAK